MKKLLARLAVLGFALASSTGSAALSPEEGTFSIAARLGIAPSMFNEDARFTSTAHLFGVQPVASPSDISTGTLTRTSRKVAFSKIYTVPFFMGYDLAYMTSDCFELFFNFDYSHACAKDFRIASNVGTIAANTNWRFKDLHQYGFYFGGRFYFKPMNSILPFLGAKIGVKGASTCGADEGIDLDGTGLRFTRLKGSDCSALSGGLQGGFDWCISENYFMTFMTEMIGTSQRQFNSFFQIHKAANNVVNPQTGNLGLASQVTRNPRATLAFPVTLGLRIRL